MDEKLLEEKLSRENENKLKIFLRWLFLPTTFFLAKPAASIMIWFQTWFFSPDSFYVTTVAPLIARFITGVFLIYFAYEVAPKGKLTVVNIYFGMLATIAVISLLMTPFDIVVLAQDSVTLLGSVASLYFLHQES